MGKTDEEICKFAGERDPGPWMVADSCSWRRIVNAIKHNPVIVPTNHHHDGTPDLDANRDILEHVARFSPVVVGRYIKIEKAARKYAELVTANMTHDASKTAKAFDELLELLGE